MVEVAGAAYAMVRFEAVVEPSVMSAVSRRVEAPTTVRVDCGVEVPMPMLPDAIAVPVASRPVPKRRLPMLRVLLLSAAGVSML